MNAILARRSTLARRSAYGALALALLAAVVVGAVSSGTGL
jgi:hypothetical protein